MDVKQGRDYLTLSDLEQHSIWKFNDTDDLIYPVTCAKDFPEGGFDLRIRVKFITPKGIELLGYIVGVQNVYSIAIYVGDKKFRFNRNLPGDYLKTLVFVPHSSE